MAKLIKAPKNPFNWAKTVIAVVCTSFGIGVAFAGFLPLKAKTMTNSLEIANIKLNQVKVFERLKERSEDIKEIKNDVKLLLIKLGK